MKNPVALGACSLAALLFTGIASSSVRQDGPCRRPRGERGRSKPAPDNAKRGRAVFTANCQKCHGPEAKGDGPDSDPRSPAADLTDEFRYELNPPGVIYHKVLDGHPPQMPAFKSTLSPDADLAGRRVRDVHPEEAVTMGGSIADCRGAGRAGAAPCRRCG